uniref:Uncharacterized protein n=1 Tax=Ditylenchus dipsaci TaxID=166011 RepID=A0A915EGD2_9BILA
MGKLNVFVDFGFTAAQKQHRLIVIVVLLLSVCGHNQHTCIYGKQREFPLSSSVDNVVDSGSGAGDISPLLGLPIDSSNGSGSGLSQLLSDMGKLGWAQ